MFSSLLIKKQRENTLHKETIRRLFEWNMMSFVFVDVEKTTTEHELDRTERTRRDPTANTKEKNDNSEQQQQNKRQKSKISIKIAFDA